MILFLIRQLLFCSVLIIHITCVPVFKLSGVMPGKRSCKVAVPVGVGSNGEPLPLDNTDKCTVQHKAVWEKTMKAGKCLKALLRIGMRLLPRRTRMFSANLWMERWTQRLATVVILRSILARRQRRDGARRSVDCMFSFFFELHSCYVFELFQTVVPTTRKRKYAQIAISYTAMRLKYRELFGEAAEMVTSGKKMACGSRNKKLDHGLIRRRTVWQQLWPALCTVVIITTVSLFFATTINNKATKTSTTCNINQQQSTTSSNKQQQSTTSNNKQQQATTSNNKQQQSNNKQQDLTISLVVDWRLAVVKQMGGGGKRTHQDSHDACTYTCTYSNDNNSISVPATTPHIINVIVKQALCNSNNNPNNSNTSNNNNNNTNKTNNKIIINN